MVRKRMLFRLGAVAILFLAGVASIARADYSTTSADQISWSTFTGQFTVVDGPTSSPYKFLASGEKGNIVSAAYENSSSGIYAYLYQIQVTSGTAHQLLVNWNPIATFVQFPPPATTLPTPPSTGGGFNPAASGSGGDGAIYEITSGSPTGPFVGLASLMMKRSNFIDAIQPTGSVAGALELNYSGLSTGDYSAIAVVFSTAVPVFGPVGGMTEGSSALDPHTYPNVWQPGVVPEPSAAALWGLGVLSLVVAAGYRRLRARVSLA